MDKTVKHARLLILACLLGCSAMLLPYSFGQPYSPEVLSAVHEQRLNALEAQQAQMMASVSAIEGKINYLFGGIAGIYGLMAIIGFFNLNVLKKK